MNKINVLQLSDTLGIGGTQKALQIFTEHLIKNIFNVYVCGIFEGGEREKILRSNGYETYVLRGSQKELILLMKMKKIDIVHYHRIRKNHRFVIDAARKAGVPAIVETNVFGQSDEIGFGRLIDMHFLISKHTALRYMQNEKISIHEFLVNCRVMYYPVNLKEFDECRLSKKEMELFKIKIGARKGTPLIARVGRPDMWKWTEFSIDVMSHILNRMPSVKYLIVGGIPDPIVSKIKKLKLEKSFLSIGTVLKRKLIAVYKSIDILAHSSKLGESFGYTIAEAMAAKKPVVVNSTPWVDNAQIELVDNGKTGLIANTPRTYADAVICLLEDRREAGRMGLAGYEKVKKQYNAEKITRMLEKIYVELLIRKGMDIDADVLDKYKNIKFFPTDQEVINYPKEYERRLLDYFGNPTRLERLRSELKYHGRLIAWKKAKRAYNNLTRSLKHIHTCDKSRARS